MTRGSEINQGVTSQHLTKGQLVLYQPSRETPVKKYLSCWVSTQSVQEGSFLSQLSLSPCWGPLRRLA
jgi:hypothetical protein